MIGWKNNKVNLRENNHTSKQKKGFKSGMTEIIEANKRKKVIPQNIQKAIDKYLEETDFYEPKTIKLKSCQEFDSIKHSRDYIKFAPGGKVGDKEWSLQYMHNLPIMLEYQKRKNKEVLFAPETMIRISREKNPKKINIYVDDFHLDSIDTRWAEIADYFYDIRPEKYIDPSLVHVHLDYLFEDDAIPDRVKIEIEYENEKECITMNDIVIIRYNV